MSIPDEKALAALAQRLTGPLLRPDDADYATEIAPFNMAITHSPDLVVGAESDADVTEAVRFAREHGLGVTAQATGHTESAITSGLLVSTRRLDRVEVDAGAGTATIGAGVRWESVITAAAEHGLAPISGSSTGVGVVGYLLGGGIGPLTRSHGFSSDYLLEAEVVTGTGEIVRASAAGHPDLLWALRGGKAGLGIVTEVRIRLIELASLYAGSMMFAEEDIDAALRAWVEWTADADERVTTSVAIIRFPPLDVVPEPLRGRRLLSLRFAVAGSAEEGEHLAAPLRSAAPVYLDDLGVMPTTEMARIHNDPTDPSPDWVDGLLLDRIDQNLATAFLQRFGAGTDAPFVSAEIRHYGGKATRSDAEGGSAVGGRDADFTLAVVAADPSLFESATPAAFAELTEAVAPWTSSEMNVNFMGKPDTAERYASAWRAEIRARLDAVRALYDPDGVFAFGYTPG
jgi:FAD/FMN-containing dehydrogenase